MGRRRAGSIILGVALAGLTVAVLFTPVQCLSVVDAGSGRVLFRTRVKPGYEFATWIIHSVQLTPVEERFRVLADGRIMATSIELSDLGWGLPSTVDQPVRTAGGRLHIDGYSIVLDELPFRVCEINKPELILLTGGSSIPLLSLVDDQDGIRIRVDRLPRYSWYMRGDEHVQLVPAARGAARQGD